MLYKFHIKQLTTTKEFPKKKKKPKKHAALTKIMQETMLERLLTLWEYRPQLF